MLSWRAKRTDMQCQCGCVNKKESVDREGSFVLLLLVLFCFFRFSFFFF